MLPVGLGGGHVREGFVDADLLHQGCLIEEYGHDPPRHFAVAVVAALGPYRMGAKRPGDRRRHGAADAVSPGLVGRRRHDAPVLRAPSDDHRLAPPARMVELLDRGEERIEVYQQQRLAVPRGQDGLPRLGPLCRCRRETVSAHCRTGTGRRRE